MRISNQMLYNMIDTNIGRNQESVFDLQQRISSGKAIERPSDDPGLYESIQRIHADADNIEQYERNAELATRELLTTESALQNILNIFHRASEIAISGGDGTIQDQDRTTMGGEVNELLDQLVGIANFSEGGRYIFAGLRTNQPAYTTVDTTANGMVDSVIYNGSTEVKQVEISKDIFVTSNIPGSDSGSNNAIFEPSDAGANLFTNLINLRDRLLAGNNITTTTSLDDLTHSMDHIINSISVVGAREEKVKMTSDLLSQRQITLQGSLENMEAIDIAEAVMKLSAGQAAYEASLRSSAMILGGHSLMDYI